MKAALPKSPGPWCTTEEAATRLRKSVDGFRSWKSRHNRAHPKAQLTAYRIGGVLLFKVTDIDRFVEVAEPCEAAS